MKRILLLFLLVAGTAAANRAAAQTFGRTKLSVHVGAAVPVGKFSNMADDGLGAAMGAMMGMRTSWEVNSAAWGIDNTNQINIFANLDAAMNGLRSDAKKLMSGFEELGIKMKHPLRYYNVPLMVGAQWRHSFDQRLSLWGEMGVGLNLRMISKQSLEFDPVLWENFSPSLSIPDGENSRLAHVDQKTQARVGWGMQIGAGAMFGRHLSLGVHLYHLAAIKVRVRTSFVSDIEGYNRGEWEDAGNSPAHNMLVVRAGWHF